MSSLSVAEELHDCLSDLHALLVPPLGEEGDLGVHELPLGVVRQVARHVVQDVLHLVLVVLLVRLDPAWKVILEYCDLNIQVALQFVP